MVGRYCAVRMASDRQGLAVMSGSFKAVVFNVVGSLADMSLYADVLDSGRDAQAWEAFFARIPDAKVVEDHRDLVWAVTDLGYSPVYSSMCPMFTAADTRGWLAVHEFPEGPVLFRRGGDRSAAPRVKRGHCAAVMLQGQRWLRGFVDHDLDVVRYLRNQKIPGHSFEYLLGLRIGELRAELEERAFDVRPSTNPYRGCVRV